jgi:hypothetical protein
LLIRNTPYCLLGGELVLNIEFPGEKLELVSFRGNRALFLNSSAK